MTGGTEEDAIDKLGGLEKVSDSLQPYNPKSLTFMSELEALINRYSLENESDSPDFILAAYLRETLTLFGQTVKARDNWYKFDPWRFDTTTQVTDLRAADPDTRTPIIRA